MITIPLFEEENKLTLPQLAEELRDMFGKSFKDNYLHIGYSKNIMDNVGINFSIETKENWPNKIWMNATKFTFIIYATKNGKEVQRESEGDGNYRIEVDQFSRGLAEYNIKKLTARTGTLPKIKEYVTKYLKSIEKKD